MSTQFCSIEPYLTGRAPPGATTPGQSEPWSNGNDGILCILQSTSIIPASDCCVISRTLVRGGVLPLFRGAVGVSYSPLQPTGQFWFWVVSYFFREILWFLLRNSLIPFSFISASLIASASKFARYLLFPLREFWYFLDCIVPFLLLSLLRIHFQHFAFLRVKFHSCVLAEDSNRLYYCFKDLFDLGKHFHIIRVHEILHLSSSFSNYSFFLRFSSQQ